MEIAGTEDPVSWLKKQPQNYSTRHSVTTNSKSPSNRRISAMIQDEDILPKDRRPASPAWSNPDMASPTTSSSPSLTPTTSTSTAPSIQKIFSAPSASAHGFLPRLDLDLGPVMMMRPRDNEDEEDDDDDDDDERLFSGRSSPSSTNEDLYRHIRSLKEQLEDARRQASAYQEQLAQQERTTQQLVTKYMEEKERETVRVHQLVDLVEKQEQLIQALCEGEPAPSSVHRELSQLRQELEALHFEKRSLETRVAAFLNDELDVSKVSLLSNDDDELYTIAALGYRSSCSEHTQLDGLASQTDLHRRSSSILLDTDQYSLLAFGSPRSNNTAERVTSLGSTMRHTNQSALNLVEEEEVEDDTVSAYSSIAASSLAMSFSSPPSSMNGAYNDSRFSYLKSSPLRNSASSISSQQALSPSAAANAARKAAWARIMIPPATPPPNHPLPPIPPKLSRDGDSDEVGSNSSSSSSSSSSSRSRNSGKSSHFDETELHQDYDAAPRFHRSCSPSRTQSSPLAMTPAATTTMNNNKQPQPTTGTKHQSIDTLPGSPNSSLTSAPPVLTYQAAETNHATSAPAFNGDMTDDRHGFWKGMKKKWKMK
ncbi:hypothetical protein BX666DRAFT_2031359 [Dichotomocladium elegans]|nr:hypothetical protein BX666DRAFT_2031359 [Dichotomocladium elegans]